MSVTDLKAERSFTVDADLDTIRDRLITSMGRLGYKCTRTDPLMFERGSAHGRFLSLSMIDWVTAITVQLEAKSNFSTYVLFSVNMPHAFADKGFMEGRRAISFWEREMEIIEKIARTGDFSYGESYFAEVQLLIKRELVGWLSMTIVLSAGLAVIGLVAIQFGLFRNPVIQFSLFGVALIDLFIAIVFIHNLRRLSRSRILIK